jgi:hypothetical protein
VAGELGLTNSFKQRVYGPLQKYRGSDGESGKEISLIDFMATRAINESGEAVGLKNTSGNPISMVDLWCDLGLDPSAITLDNLITLSDDVRYLAPELIRDFIVKGMETDAAYTQLVSSSISAPSLTVTSPWVEFSDAAPSDTAEAETISETDITWGDKTVRLRKKAKAIKVSDELMLSTPIALLSQYLMRFGKLLSASLFTDGVTCLVNGDQADTTDACAVVGVTSNGTLAFADLVRAWVRARQIMMSWDNLVTSEATANTVLGITEFKAPSGFGTPYVNVESKNRILPASMPHLISSVLDDGQCLLFDKAQAMIYLQFRGLTVESERIVMRQLNGTACSVIGGFSNTFRHARVIVDSGHAYGTSYVFPSWMDPIV